MADRPRGAVMTAFSFDAKAALQDAKRSRRFPTVPTVPTLPTDRQAEGGKVGTVGTVGTVRVSEREPAPAAPDDPIALDPDGVARTPEAIEAVWSDAVRRAVEFRRTQPAPTCSSNGAITTIRPDRTAP